MDTIFEGSGEKQIKSDQNSSIEVSGDGKSTATSEPETMRVPAKECLQELCVQFQHISMAMNGVTNLLLDYVTGVEVSRSEILPRIVQLMNRVNTEKLKQNSDWLAPDERRIFGDFCARLAECEQVTNNHMNKIADLRHSELRQQSNKISELEATIEQKDRTIMSLKTTDNVILWTKEKTRILKEHDEIIERLNSKMREVEQQRDMYKKKLAEQSDDLKTEKLKFDINRRRSTAHLLPEVSDLALLEDLKRKVYLYERDVQNAQQEVNRFQTDMLGMWGGLQGELSTAAEGTKDVVLSGRLKSLVEVIDKIKCSVAGTLDLRVVRADLNERYLPGLTNKDFFVTSRGKKVQIKPIPIRKFSNFANKASTLEPIMSESGSKSKEMMVKQVGRDKSPLPQTPAEPADANNKVNPSLLNGISGSLNMLAVMKHFPTLSANYVKSQWENFKNYDLDGNGELDMSEIMNAITRIMPKNLKADYIESAMKEVDSDGSGTMDFYEYLQVAMLLEQKKGKSALFHNPDVQKHTKQISKTCLIQ